MLEMAKILYPLKNKISDRDLDFCNTEHHASFKRYMKIVVTNSHARKQFKQEPLRFNSLLHEAVRVHYWQTLSALFLGRKQPKMKAFWIFENKEMKKLFHYSLEDFISVILSHRTLL